MKNWYQSKTIWVAIIQVIAGLFMVFSTQYPDVGAIVIGKSVIDVILRFITETSISSQAE